MRKILHQRWPWALAAVGVVLVYFFTAVEFRRSGLDARPVGGVEEILALRERDDVNVLFLLIDTLRAERLGSYGYERATSPILDELARRGVRFGRHIAQSSWTKTSMASLWTGLYPGRAGVLRFNDVLSEDAELPAELLRSAGFRTAGLYRNGWVSPYFGFGQGFEIYDKPIGSAIPASARRENPTLENVGTDLQVVDSGLEFMRVHQAGRWLLYMHLMDLHEYVYDLDSARFGSDNAGLYDNSVLRINNVIGGLLQEMQRRGYLDNTLVVIAADHGEAFGERGFEGHARAVYPETTVVPFILSFPFRLEPGIVVASASQNIDIWPTLLDLLGLPDLPDSDGRSRVPEIVAAARGEKLPDGNDDAAYAYLDQNWGRASAPPSPSIAVEQGEYRFVTGRTAAGRMAEELFQNDGAENLMSTQTAIGESLRDLARSHLELEINWRAPEPLELDEMDIKQLRALGYSVPGN